ncbi:competence type IV pilus major pilin ComGC [Oenococcus kitaharae]|uniref:Late competence protein n=1 Tax=Oenococcus kitaharae DSM 17330 TaxID=1045004 RepID=G9WJS8_9LACO|nr:competence type IV pilus major pilin ComGC [Oenococcus kitaharae]EHN59277.1 Late competence protein [Oenococcus kitaharae DSM 17330]
MKKLIMKMKQKRGKESAFTLIEMAVVLFIIGLLMLLVLPNLNSQRQKAADTQSDAMVSMIQTQVNLYENDTDDTSVSYSDLVSGRYLTDKQAAKAQSLGITINGDNVTK